jgi:hypothetical protein
MKRIASGTQAAALPTHPAGTGTAGYFVDAATTPTGTPTSLTPEWFNAVQESIVRTIEDGGGTPATDFDLFKTTVSGVHGIKAHATSLSNVTTPKTRVALASATVTVSGAHSAAVAASGTIGVTGARSAAIACEGIVVASGADSAVMAVSGGIASGDQSAVVGGTSTAASGHRSVCLGGSSAASSAADAATLGGDNPTASGLKAVAAGGHDLTASGENAAAIGGDTNVAAADESFVGGGNSHDIQSGSTRAAVVGGNNHTITAARAIALGGDSHILGGADSAALGGANNIVSAAKSFVIGGTGNDIASGAAQCGVLASDTCQVLATSSKTNMLLVASKNAELHTDGDPSSGGADGFCLALGYNASNPGATVINTNLTIMLAGKHGIIQTSGAITASTDPNSDFAEMFENAEPGSIPDGTLLARVGRKVRIARPGDRVMGVVSATPGILLGTGGLHYAKRYATNEFGRPLLNEDGSRMDAQGYDNQRPNVARTARPDEWTAVALVGQVRVRIGKGVEEGDYLTPGADGCALGTLARPDGRPVEVMEITTPFDAARGYGVALCLVG